MQHNSDAWKEESVPVPLVGPVLWLLITSNDKPYKGIKGRECKYDKQNNTCCHISHDCNYKCIVPNVACAFGLAMECVS
jgi:hypothetical protein